MDGSTHSLEEFAGMPVAVVFSCVHCPYVVAWENRLNEIARDYSGRAGLVAINSNDHLGDTFDHMVARAARQGVRLSVPPRRVAGSRGGLSAGAHTRGLSVRQRPPARLPRRAGLGLPGSGSGDALPARRPGGSPRRPRARRRRDAGRRLHRQMAVVGDGGGTFSSRYHAIESVRPYPSAVRRSSIPADWPNESSRSTSA